MTIRLIFARLMLVVSAASLVLSCRHNSSATRILDRKDDISSPQSNADIDPFIASQLMREGGFTLNRFRGNMSGSGFYAVSVYPERSRIADHLPTVDEIKEYIRANGELLNMPMNSLGGWCEGESMGPPCFLDISRTIKDRRVAEALGKACNQQSIAFLGKKVSFINTGGTGKTPTGNKLKECIALRDMPSAETAP